MVDFTGRLRAVKWDEFRAYGFEGEDIKTKGEIKKEYNDAIKQMRANRDAALAMWDYMHSVGVQKKVAALQGDVLMYVFPPQELDTIAGYIDYPESAEMDTAEIRNYDIEGSKQEISDILDEALNTEEESREEWSDFEAPLDDLEESEA